MEVKIDHRANRMVVVCQGRLDARGGPELEQSLSPLLDRGADGPIALDLSQVDYVSSAGIRSLLYINKVLADKNEAPDDQAAPVCRLVNLSPAVKGVLDMAGVWPALGGETPRPPGPTSGPEEAYPGVMDKVKTAFPAPVSDFTRDAHFVQQVARGLDLVDGLKTDRPYLGQRKPLEYDRVKRRTMPEGLAPVELVVDELAGYMEGLMIWGHPRTQENVIPPASIPSIIGHFFAAVYNPNIIWDEYSHRLAEAEMETVAMCSDLLGYDPGQSGGVFTWGGTGTIFYGVKLGLEKAWPGTFKTGVRPAKVVSSEAGHYAKLNALGWLGLGCDQLVTVPTDQDNSLDLSELEKSLTDLVERGKKIACIICTMGATDSFGMDNLAYAVHLRDQLVERYDLDYRPHIHADAVIGWPWAVFNDYDFRANPMNFPPEALRCLADTSAQVRFLGMADSIGLDFHKTGYTPYVSSLFLCRDRADLNLISREAEAMPYLYQFGAYHPGVFTMETSRAGGSVLAALANLKLLGKTGFRALLGHIVTMAEELRAKLNRLSHACVINDYNYGPVTLFRVYPDGVDAAAAYRREADDPAAGADLLKHNDYNRRVFQAMHRLMEQGRGTALSQTDHYRTAAGGEPILALKSFIMSPFTDSAAVDELTDCLEEARREVD